jgi:hypothetical protein
MQFKDMDAGHISATAAAFLSLAFAIGVLSISIGVLGALGSVAFVGLGILTAAGIILAATVSSIVAGVNELNEAKVSSFATVLSSLAQLATMSLAGTGVPAFISEIVEALDEIPNDTTKMVNLSTTADSLTNLMRVSATVEEAQLANIKMIIEGVSNSEGNENVGKLTSTLASMLGTLSGGRDSETRKIVIELDGNKLGEYIDRRENAKARKWARFT